jgi:uridylate kinase
MVTGGGAIARKYITVARELGGSEAFCDQLGIYVSRLNARLLIAALGHVAYPEVPSTIEELRRYFAHGRIVAMGGLQPGQSTNAVAAVVAETIHAQLLVNLTDVEGVYSGDPKSDSSARKLDTVTPNQLSQILSRQPLGAGQYELMDDVAIRVVERSRLPVVIADGRDVKNLERAMAGKKVGTRIVHGK